MNENNDDDVRRLLSPDRRHDRRSKCPVDDSMQRASIRLREPYHAWLYSPLKDFFFGAFVWMAAVSLGALLLRRLAVGVPDVLLWSQSNLQNPNVTAALSAMLTFFVVSRSSANLQQNASIVATYGSICGACVGLSMQLRGLTKNGRVNLVDTRKDFTTELKSAMNKDGYFFECYTQMSCLVRALPYVVLHQYQSDQSTVEARLATLSSFNLPLEDNRAVKKNMEALIRRGMTPFLATLYYVTCIVAQLDEAGHLKTPEVALVMKHAFDISRLEGDIDSFVSFRQAAIVDVLVYSLLALYFAILVMADLTETSDITVVWVGALVACSTAGVYGISLRLKNPLSSALKRGRQAAMMLASAQTTERQIYVMLEAKRPVS